MVTVTSTDVSGRDRLLDVNLFVDVFDNDNDLEQQNALYERIAAATPDELAPFLQERHETGQTALLHAAALGHRRLARLLLDKGADHKVRDGNDGTTLLMKGTAALNYFLQELDCSDIINAQDNDGWTALHWVIEDPDDVELLLKHGANPDIPDSKGATPLHFSAYNGNAQSAALLRQYGANLRLTDNSQRNILHQVFVDGIVRQSAQFVHWLLDDVGAEDLMVAKDRFGRTPLDEAFRQEDNPERHHITSALLNQYTVNVVSREGGLCLHWILRAATYKKRKVTLPVGTLTIERMLEFLLVLLTLSASVGLNLIFRCDDTGALPLHTACQYPKSPIQLIAFLVEQDPSTLCRTDHAGNLPIHMLCATRPALRKVKFLLGCDEKSISAWNNQGCSPFEVAALASASVEVLWFLMKVDPVVALASLCRS